MNWKIFDVIEQLPPQVSDTIPGLEQITPHIPPDHHRVIRCRASKALGVARCKKSAAVRMAGAISDRGSWRSEQLE